jgi:hypothetical protein
MEFAACLVFICLVFFCSNASDVKTAAAIFWLVVLFIGFITSPDQPPTPPAKE